MFNRNLKNLYEEVKQVVKDHPEIKIELIGHSDNIGGAEDNYNLALNYAKQVAAEKSLKVNYFWFFSHLVGKSLDDFK